MRARTRIAAVPLAAVLFASACAQVLGIDELDVRDASVQPEASAGSSGAPPDASSEPDAEKVETGDDTGKDAEASADTADAPDGEAEASSCPPGQKPCSGQCVPITQTATGCAAVSCDPCQFNHASAICDSMSGQCAIHSCALGYGDCDNDPSTGCEASLNTDPEHCQACAKSCVIAGTVATCSAGVCGMSGCLPGYANCDNLASNGCEVHTDADKDNCGACGLGCSFPHAGATCVAGICTLASCSADYANCDSVAANGCEAYTLTDPQNCGTCGHPCGASMACKNGQCQSTTCIAPMQDCDGNSTSGCETNLNTDPSNCGACGATCDLAQATAACSAGLCEIASCNAGFGNCDTLAANGCETATSTSPNDCGTCGNICQDPGNTVPACASGTCTFSCASGYGDCTSGAGCETELASSMDHCGACNAPCALTHATSVCSGGLCQIQQCSTGFSDCDNDAANGCESPTSGDALHCGACTRACSIQNVSSRSCNSSVCDSSCALGHANCNLEQGPIDDGCETAANQNAKCGGCQNDCTQQGGGFVCGGTGKPDYLCSCTDKASCGGQATASTCTASGLCHCSNKTCKRGESCVFNGGKDECSCNGGDGCGAGQTCCQTPAGCKNLETDPANCGACGHGCPSGFKCTNSHCACNGGASCDAGTAGTCGSGKCSCNGTLCAQGQRCLSDGTCG